MKIAILDDYQNTALTQADWSGVQARAEITVFDRNLTVEEAAEALKPFDILVMLRERLAMPASLIEALPNLKMLALTGPGHRTLDLGAAKAKGIVVSHTETRPGISFATAELTMALLLGMMRNLPTEEANIRAGRWQTTVGEILYGKTLGIVGLGRLGQRVAKFARAFDMNILAWSQNLTAEKAAEGGASLASKEDLFAKSDAVSLHLVLSDRSRGVVGGPEIAAMKPGAILINTSRGPLVDKAALFAALKAGRIRAALDVYDIEPLPADSDWRALPNTLLTPHLGYVTTETYRAFYEDVVENITGFLDGAPIRVL